MKVFILIPVACSLIFASCKKLPTFSPDNPNDYFSENFVISPPQNVDFTLTNFNTFNITWETDNLEAQQDEVTFLIKLIQDGESIQETVTNNYATSTNFVYEILPNHDYQVSVTTLFNQKESEPSLSASVINVTFPGSTDVSFSQSNNSTIIFNWRQNDGFSLDQEIYLKDEVTNEVSTFNFSGTENNYYSITFSELNITHSYEVGISKVLNNIQSDPITTRFIYSDDIEMNVIYSFDKTEDDISFFHTDYIPFTDYIVATNPSGTEVFVINTKTKQIERTINTPTSGIAHIVGRIDDTFYTYQRGKVYKGNIHTGAYNLFIQTQNAASSLPFFGLTGMNYQYLYYPTNDKVIFYNVDDASDVFEIPNDGINTICIGYMEDQLLTLSENEVKFYTYPSPELRYTYTAQQGVFFNSCEFNTNLSQVYLSGYNSNNQEHFFASMDKGVGTFENYTIISNETGFGPLHHNQFKDQIIVTSFDPQFPDLNGSPFYVYDIETETLTKTKSLYRGLNNPAHSIAHDGHLVYTTAEPQGILEEIFIGEGWVLNKN